jgi:hypothetical protein
MAVDTSFVTHVVALSLVALLGSRTVVRAQTPVDFREHARGHIGPFYVAPTLAVEELGVDTNVFNSSDAKADFTTTVKPHGDVWLPLGQRGLITASSTVGLVYYQTFASERAVNPDVSLRGDLRLHRLTFFAAGSYSNSRSRPNLEIDTRARHEQRGAEAGVSVQLTPRTSVALSALQSRTSFDENAVFNSVSLRDALNRRTRAATADVRYELTPLTRVFVRGQALEDRFTFSPIHDAESVAILPGVEFQPRALISGSAAVGVRRFKPSHPAVPDDTGVVATANLSYALHAATRFRFTATRDVAYSYSDAQPYYGIAAYGLLVSRHLGGRFDATAAGEWETHRYRRLTDLVRLPPTSALLPAAVNRIQTWSAGMGYRLARSQRLGIGVAYRTRDSNTAELNSRYSGIRVMASLNSES